MTLPDPVRKAARRAADGEAVDWEGLAREHPQHASRIRMISRLASMARVSLGRQDPAVPGDPSSGAASPSDAAASSAASVRSAPFASSEPGGPGGGGFPPLPFRWGSLEVRERIGAGSFGVVFRAYDPALQREVALKLRLTLEEGPASADASEGGLAGALEEARLHARVRHPNVPAIHGVELRDGRIGFWTDILDGETWEQRLQRLGPQSAEVTIRAGCDLARALSAVHAAGLIHGDVKTANAMREESGRTLLLDFGAGVRLEARGGIHSGTPFFMAPELLQGGPASVAADLYALGAVLYRLLTGRHPVEAPDWAELLDRHRRGERLPLADARPGLPALLGRAIERALAVDPVRRPATAKEMELALRAAIEEDLAPGGPQLPSDDPGCMVPGFPTFSTRFVGRHQETRALRRLLLEPGLVTVAGPGGAGKTRLAHRVALEVAPAMTLGGRWVDLAGATSDALVGVLVMDAFQLKDHAGQEPLERLADHLAGGSALLVLDNCEHLVAACRGLARSLLAAAPRLRILATSQIPLRVEDERIYRVPSLSVPRGGERAPVADVSRPGAALSILDADAVRLFIDRVARGRPGYALTPADAPFVSRIVRRLDGIPLAIELAAARAVTLGIRVVAERLEADDRLLSGRDPRAADRHRNIRGSIAWSRDLLRPAEAKLLDRLSVFAGGFTLEAAEEVCRDPRPETTREGRPDPAPDLPGEASEATIDGEPVVELLTSLVEASLAHFEPEPRPRYRLLELVRGTSAEHLRTSGEAEATTRRLLQWGERFASRQRPRLFGPEQDDALERLADERDNLRAILDQATRPAADAAEPSSSAADVAEPFSPGGRRAAAAGEWRGRLSSPAGAMDERDADEASVFQLWVTVRESWMMRGWYRELIALTEKVIRRATREAPLLSYAMLGLSAALTQTGDIEAARGWAEAGTAMARRIDSKRLIGSGLASLGNLARIAQEYDRARALLRESIEIHRAGGAKVAMAHSLGNLGVVEGCAGNLDACERHYREAIEVLRELGETTTVAILQSNLGYAAYQRGDLPRARELLHESLAVQRAAANSAHLAIGLIYLAAVEIQAGTPEALALLLEACSALRRDENMQHLARLLELAARWLASKARPAEAAEVLAASVSLREYACYPVDAGDHAAHDALVHVLRSALSEASFALSSARGRAIARTALLDTVERMIKQA